MTIEEWENSLFNFFLLARSLRQTAAAAANRDRWHVSSRSDLIEVDFKLLNLKEYSLSVVYCLSPEVHNDYYNECSLLSGMWHRVCWVSGSCCQRSTHGRADWGTLGLPARGHNTETVTPPHLLTSSHSRTQSTTKYHPPTIVSRLAFGENSLLLRRDKGVNPVRRKHWDLSRRDIKCLVIYITWR